MRVHAASLPGGVGPGQDRWAAAGNAVVVLDGATSFRPSTVDATQYVDELVRTLRDRLTAEPGPLPLVLRESIADVKAKLDLEPSAAPSSTVLLARETGSAFEILVLGDSTVLVKIRDGALLRFTDARLDHVATSLRTAYRTRLQGGGGYDEGHRELLAQLQGEEAQVRNTSGGYWIAGADERAADEAMVYSLPADDVEFCIMATDGAQRPIDHLGIDWTELSDTGPDDLQGLLARLHEWEATEDPGGSLLPRAKRHDDKIIVVCRPA